MSPGITVESLLWLQIHPDTQLLHERANQQTALLMVAKDRVLSEHSLFLVAEEVEYSRVTKTTLCWTAY